MFQNCDFFHHLNSCSSLKFAAMQQAGGTPKSSRRVGAPYFNAAARIRKFNGGATKAGSLKFASP
jgi:hypothetical protein